jgi:hypothetical protein
LGLVYNPAQDVKLWEMAQVTISKCNQLFAACLVILVNMVLIINAIDAIELARNVQLIQHALVAKV